MTSCHSPWAKVIPMWVQVHRFVPAESSGTLRRPCCGACSRRTRSARAGCCLTRPRGGRDRLWSACASSTGGGCNGSSIVARDVRVRRRLSFMGVHLFAHWLDHQAAFDPVVAQLTQAIETHKHTHPDDDFALLHHREQTLRHRFQALFFAPLFGIEHLTEFDTREHPLATLVPAHAGQITSIDGPMIASWSRVAMHKGTITMRGRIMAGSQAVIAHNEAGYAVFVAYHPPDIHLSQIVVASCHKVAEATGSTVCVIDRAVNSLAVAVAFTTQDWGLLCMLDDHEHHGLESFEATPEGPLDDGSQVESGSWKAPKDDDPRLLVIVVPTEGKPFVYWGTP